MESGKVSPRVFGDELGCGPDLMRIPDSNVSYAIDRRRHARLPLAWTVYLIRPASVEIVEGKTKNVSCDGFYCFVHEPFAAGESIRCVILIPAFDTQQPERMLSLECQARVLRVDPVPTGNGIACRIDDYRIVLISPDARSQIAAFPPWSAMQA
jgi:hypothetical protein